MSDESLIAIHALGGHKLSLDYSEWLQEKTQFGVKSGFKPKFLPDYLFDFQRDLVTWAVEKGRAAVFADCGMGKTPMQLVWAQNVVQHTNKSVLILCPLAVSAQTIREAEKFHVECQRSRTGSHEGTRIVVTNYEQLHRRTIISSWEPLVKRWANSVTWTC
jgi:superfamily II DNA or RNA helicase